jgi:GAF domain-containing protein
MSNYLYDPETRKHFTEIRLANERARRAKEERDASLRAELAKTAAQRAAEQQRLLAARLASDLRNAFFTANPGATEQDWQRLAPQMRDDHMRAAAAVGAGNVFDKIRDEAEKRRQAEIDRRARFEQLPERA